MATDLQTEIKQRKLERMRLGQAICEFVDLVDTPGVRVAVVPLSDAESSNALYAAAMIEVSENVAGLMFRDHMQRVELLAYAIRDPQNLSERVYRTGAELQEDLTEVEINQVFDTFSEMTESSNPAIEGIDSEEFEILKKALQEMNWSALSGRSWYAAKRFLGAAIQDGQLLDNLRGSTFSTKLTTPNE